MRKAILAIGLSCFAIGVFGPASVGAVNASDRVEKRNLFFTSNQENPTLGTSSTATEDVSEEQEVEARLRRVEEAEEARSSASPAELAQMEAAFEAAQLQYSRALDAVQEAFDARIAARDTLV